MANQPANTDDNIIKLLGLEALPEERRVEMLNRMTELVQKRVILRLMENLTEADAAEAEKLADRPDELLAFMSAKSGNVADIIADETAKLKNELVMGAGADEAAAE